MGKVTAIDHTADMRLRVEGSSPDDLFTTMADALARELGIEGGADRPLNGISFTVEGSDAEMAVQVANEILYYLQVKKCRVSGVRVHPAAERWDVEFDLLPHRGVCEEIKAATYDRVHWERGENRTTFEITFDR